MESLHTRIWKNNKEMQVSTIPRALCILACILPCQEFMDIAPNTLTRVCADACILVSLLASAFVVKCFFGSPKHNLLCGFCGLMLHVKQWGLCTNFLPTF